MSITPFFHVYHKYVFNMANINKIKLSGTTYNIQDENATKTVELTQAQYDALSVKDPNTFYIITDATAGDLSNYYTKSETDNAITAATSTKQDTLVSGTNIKTINNESILGSGNIEIEGGGSSINVVQTTGTSTADVMSQDAVTTKFKTKLNNVGVQHQPSTSNYSQLNLYLDKEGSVSQSLFTYVKTINGKSITSQSKDNLEGLSLIETSAITTSISSSSTDSQVPSAKAVYDALQEGGSSITVDTALDSGSTNPVENRVIYNKIDEVEQVTARALNELNETLSGKADSNSVYTKTEANVLLDEKLDVTAYTPTDLSNYYTKSETSGATQISTALDDKLDTSNFNTYTAATNSRLSEDEEVTAAGLNALNDAFGGLKLVKLSQAEYNALATKDSQTLYIIVG